MTDPETMRTAREEAEHALDGMLEAARNDLDGVPTEARFTLLMYVLARLDPGKAIMAAVCVVAVERILAGERLDLELSAEGGQLGGPESLE